MIGWAAPDSFDEFVASRYSALLRFAHVLTGDPHAAADLVQDAVVRAGMSWGRVHKREDPEGYVRRTIVNLNLNRWRSLRRERLVAAIPDAGRVDVPRHDDAMWAALALLPKAQRTVLVLRFYEDLSQAEIAELLGCTVGTVKSNGARALEKLRRILGESGDFGGGHGSVDRSSDSAGVME